MRAITLATKGVIVPIRPLEFVSGYGGRVRTDQEFPKPFIKVMSVKYTNGKDDKTEIIKVTDVKID